MKASFDQAKMKNMLKRRFLIDQSFAVSGGITGQIDFWPDGLCHESHISPVPGGIISSWQKQMLEVDCSILIPEPMLK